MLDGSPINRVDQLSKKATKKDARKGKRNSKAKKGKGKKGKAKKGRDKCGNKKAKISPRRKILRRSLSSMSKTSAPAVADDDDISAVEETVEPAWPSKRARAKDAKAEKAPKPKAKAKARGSKGKAAETGPTKAKAKAKAKAGATAKAKAKAKSSPKAKAGKPKASAKAGSRKRGSKLSDWQGFLGSLEKPFNEDEIDQIKVNGRMLLEECALEFFDDENADLPHFKVQIRESMGKFNFTRLNCYWKDSRCGLTYAGKFKQDVTSYCFHSDILPSHVLMAMACKAASLLAPWLLD